MRAATMLIIAFIAFCSALLASAETECPQAACGLPPGQIAAHPAPAVAPAPVNEDALRRWDYRRIYGDLPIYSTPDGERATYIGGGLLYVTVLEQRGDWSRIGANQWVRSEILSNRIQPSPFAGILFKGDVEQRYTVAWTLYDIRGAETPGGDEAPANSELPRYTVVNIYATVSVDGEPWHQIGEKRWAHHSQLARAMPVARPPEAQSDKWIGVDLSEQVTIAYDGEQPVFATLVSSGLEPWPTREGIFQIYARFTSRLMAGGGYSDYYYLQNVPYAMQFDDAIALHGAYWHDKFGFQRSHGCVNMSVTDAHWLYDWMQSEYDYEAGDLTGPDVYVYASQSSQPGDS